MRNVAAIKAIALAVLCALLHGCGVGQTARGGSYGYEHPPLSDPGNGQLIIYRPTSAWRERAGSYPEVLVNGVSLGGLRYNGYLVHEMPPGPATIKVTGLSATARKWSFHDRELPVSAVAGKTVFVKVLVQYDQSSNTLANPGMDYELLVSLASEDQAKYELPGMRESR